MMETMIKVLLAKGGQKSKYIEKRTQWKITNDLKNKAIS